MLNTDALLRSPFSEEPVVPNASHALGRLSLAESPAGFCQPPRLFTTKVTLLPTKPRSNDRLSERIKDDNLSPLRITLKGCYCSKSRSVKTVAGTTSQLSLSICPLLFTFSPFHRYCLQGALHTKH